MTTGERIRNLRIAKGLSQEELGLRVGVQKAAIYKYENGLVVNLKRSMIAKLAEALNVQPSYLLDFKEEEADEKKTVPENEDGLSPLDAQLMDLLRFLTDDQKKLLLAQIKILKESQ
jgi:transcriptional regulator with XRE-family HTH domain